MYRKTNEVTREEWNNLRYPIRVRRCSEEEGGGWMASIPMLGEAGFAADGNTAEEAVDALERIRRELYDHVVASGIPVPIPADDTDAAVGASGKWLMRTSRYLHHSLQKAAELQGVSFNQYCIECLIRGDALIRGVAPAAYELPKKAPAMVSEAKRKKK